MTQVAPQQLHEALAQVGDLVAHVAPPQWSAPTPCDSWDVAALVAHLVTGNRLFAAALRGGLRSEALPDLSVPADLAAAFPASAAELVDAFAEPGALERVVTVPFGTVLGAVALHLRLVEALVHGWDLAVATGQAVAFDDALVAQELEFTRGALPAIPPERRPFGPPQPAAPDASPLDRFAALLGRRAPGLAAS